MASLTQGALLPLARIAGRDLTEPPIEADQARYCCTNRCIRGKESVAAQREMGVGCEAKSCNEPEILRYVVNVW